MDNIDRNTLLALGVQARLKQLEDETEQLRALLYAATAEEKSDEKRIGGTETRRLHWTQRPENKAKVEAMHRKAKRTRKARTA